MIEAAIFVIFPFAMAFAAISDMLSMTIANRVSVILVASFLILAPFTGMAWEQYAMHVAAGALVLTITFSLFSFGAMGGGDAKLLSATSVWMGFSFVLVEYLVVASFVGGLLTLAILAFRKSPLAVYAGRVDFMRRIGDAKEGIPYGIALGIAGLFVYPHSPLMMWALASTAGH